MEDYFNILFRHYMRIPMWWVRSNGNCLLLLSREGQGWCLLDAPIVDRIGSEEHRRQLLGEKFGLDKQCELVYGKGYKLCPRLVCMTYDLWRYTYKVHNDYDFIIYFCSPLTLCRTLVTSYGVRTALRTHAQPCTLHGLMELLAEKGSGAKNDSVFQRKG